MTDGEADSPRPRPGEGDEPLRSVTLDRTGRQHASAARLVVSARSRGLWVAVAVWLLIVLGLAIWAGASVGGTVTLLLAATALATWAVSRTSMRAISAVYPKGQQVTLQTSSAGLWLRTKEGSWHAPWTDFKAAERSRHHLLLQRKGAGGALVLVPALLGPEVYDDLAAAGIPVTGD